MHTRAGSKVDTHAMVCVAALFAVAYSQAALLAASIVPVFLFARDRVGRRAAYALASASGLFWGLQRAMAFDVREMAFAPLPIATAILAKHRRQWPLFWTSVAILILIKEDLIPLIGGFGVYLAIRGERRRAVITIAASIVLFGVIVRLVVPSLNPSGGYAYGRAFTDILERPWMVPITLVTPSEKRRTVMLWFAPFLFTSVVSPLSILVAPLAANDFYPRARFIGERRFTTPLRWRPSSR